jgi:hypothetical protein
MTSGELASLSRWVGIGAVLLGVCVVACGDDPRGSLGGQADRRRIVDDDGAVCLSPRNDGAASFDVVFTACLASTCDRAENVTCDAAVADGLIGIASHLEVVRGAQYEVCPADCNYVRVSCGVLEPFVGSRTFVHGSEISEAVPFPLTKAVQLFGRGPSDCEVGSFEYSPQ